MMKKISALLAALVLLAAPVLSHAAAGGLYAFEELGISLSVPEDALAFTRDVAADDPDLAHIGYTQQDMLDLLADSGYLQAIDMDWEYEIALTMTKTSYVSMSVMDEKKLEEAAASIRESYAEEGAQVSLCEPYDSGSAVFLRIFYTYTQENYTDFVLEYYTIYNNKNISVTLFSYLGEVTAEQQSLMEGIVDGIRFTAGDPRAARSGNGGNALLNLTGNELINDIISLVAMLAACMLPVFFFRALGKKGVIPEKAATALGVILSILVCVGAVAYMVKTGRSGGYIIFTPVGALANAVRASARDRAQRRAQRKAQLADRREAKGTLEPSIPTESYAAQMDARLAGVQADRRADAARGGWGGPDGPDEPIMRRCPACGEDIVPGAAFCGECGERLRNA